MTRILIVDDSSNLRKVIRRYLPTNMNLEVYEAGDGLDAETILQEQAFNDVPIDIVLLDWMMPNMTGLQFLQKIRAVDTFKNTPDVIMLTAETYSAQINACMKYGVSHYITKPFTQEQITRAITQIREARGLKHAV